MSEEVDKVIAVGLAPDGKLHAITEKDIQKASPGEYRYVSHDGREIKIEVIDDLQKRSQVRTDL